MENAPSSKFQFYKAPLKTVHSNRTMTIKEAYQYITSLEPMERTHILRSIKNKKEARKFNFYPQEKTPRIMSSSIFAYELNLLSTIYDIDTHHS